MPTAAAHSAAHRTPATTPEIETILTTFDTNYAWNYGSVKEGLRDLYEKAKRDQWNGTTQLAWDTHVDPEGEIIPPSYNPLAGYAPFKKLDDQGREAASATRRSPAAVAVPARRAGRADRRLAARRRRAVDGRQVLRRARRPWTRRATSRCSAATCARSSSGSGRSTPT